MLPVQHLIQWGHCFSWGLYYDQHILLITFTKLWKVSLLTNRIVQSGKGQRDNARSNSYLISLKVCKMKIEYLEAVREMFERRMNDLAFVEQARCISSLPSLTFFSSRSWDFPT